jgi:hypothetical protein
LVEFALTQAMLGLPMTQFELRVFAARMTTSQTRPPPLGKRLLGAADPWQLYHHPARCSQSMIDFPTTTMQKSSGACKPSTTSTNSKKIQKVLVMTLLQHILDKRE